MKKNTSTSTHRSWTDQDRIVLLACLQAGYSTDETAVLLGRTRNAVSFRKSTMATQGEIPAGLNFRWSKETKLSQNALTRLRNAWSELTPEQQSMVHNNIRKGRSPKDLIRGASSLQPQVSSSPTRKVESPTRKVKGVRVVKGDPSEDLVRVLRALSEAGIDARVEIKIG